MSCGFGAARGVLLCPNAAPEYHGTRPLSTTPFAANIATAAALVSGFELDGEWYDVPVLEANPGDSAGHWQVSAAECGTRNR